MEQDLALRHRAELRNLSQDQKKVAEQLDGTFEREYQKWYTESFVIIRQLIPNRLTEFEQLYKGDGMRRQIDLTTYNIQDWLNGIRAGNNQVTSQKAFSDFGAMSMRFQTQLQILRAIEQRFESSLFDIRQLVQADFFDSELDAARELTKGGFLRAAGAVAGVVLEKHLSEVISNHNVAIRKQHPSISELNDALKSAGVLDVPAWRGIQRLGDLRNICDHNKHRDPTGDEVNELIDGVEKLTKTLF
jgi:hypothetical protein